MSTIDSHVESILFVSGRPLTVKKLAELTGHSAAEVHDALDRLIKKHQAVPGGVQINRIGQSYQMATTPASAKIVQTFLEEEEKKELTKPSLEALTIIAYRGPITKAELELIRGVNCSLILRNLLIRGLIESFEDAAAMTTRYQVTFDFLHYLGIRETRELPDYDKLNSDENLQRILQDSQERQQPAAGVAEKSGEPSIDAP
ncbi:MAG: SMC-Scp complex subunit ScpB [Candidatus Kerfeldbacteria bacterium]|nr:SMC-Scp complex subunit ScpB [Candidatus Kerfeldbacteria bacterium]